MADDQLEIKPCPCGCKKVCISPLFYSQEATLNRAEAEELVRRYNTQPELLAALREILGAPWTVNAQQLKVIAGAAIAKAEAPRG